MRILTLSLSSIALITAFFYEYYLGLMSCDLCIYQRIPYFLLIGISLIKNDKVFKYISVFVLLISVALSLYHTQVESGVLPDNCAKKIKHSFSIEEIIKQLNKVERPSCSSVNAKIFNVSMSTWNVVFSTFLMLVILLEPIYKRRNIFNEKYVKLTS